MKSATVPAGAHAEAGGWELSQDFEKHAAIIWGNNRYWSPIDLQSRPIAPGGTHPPLAMRWRAR
jgi:hypothetical protein